MADVNTEVIFHLKLSAKEFKLMGLALAGKLVDAKPADRTAALELNARLLSIRQQQMAQTLTTWEPALKIAQELLAADDDRAEENGGD